MKGSLFEKWYCRNRQGPRRSPAIGRRSSILVKSISLFISFFELNSCNNPDTKILHQENDFPPYFLINLPV